MNAYFYISRVRMANKSILNKPAIHFHSNLVEVFLKYISL